MKRCSWMIAAVLACAALVATGPEAAAAEIKVLASTGVTGILNELGPAFERSSERKLAIEYEVANVLKNRIQGGAGFDVAVLTAAATDDLIKDGKIVAGTRAEIARSGVGVAIRAGAPKPDISTPEAFKRALLATSSIAYSSQGASGQYFAGLLERMGIADQIRPKAKVQSGGTGLVAKGEAELAIQQISEILPVPGAELAGPLPPELHIYTVFTAGISPGAKEPQAAAAFIRYLTAPAAQPVIKAKGMEPPG